MNISIVYIIASVIIVSLVSLVGIATLVLSNRKIDGILLCFVSLSAGTLFGGAFLHLIPKAVEDAGSFTTSISFLILGGIVVFLLIDKVIHWRHSHEESSLIHKAEKKNKSIAYLNLLGDGAHNFLDGLIIAGSYLVSIPTGIAVTIGVIVHEIPQELADFGVLLYSGFSKGRALGFNFLSATTAIIGAMVGIILGTKSESFILAIIPITAGSFIYIAGSNLIPELLNEEHRLRELLHQILLFVVGILIMYALLFLE